VEYQRPISLPPSRATSKMLVQAMSELEQLKWLKIGALQQPWEGQELQRGQSHQLRLWMTAPILALVQRLQTCQNYLKDRSTLTSRGSSALEKASVTAVATEAPAFVDHKIELVGTKASVALQSRASSRSCSAKMGWLMSKVPSARTKVLALHSKPVQEASWPSYITAS